MSQILLHNNNNLDNKLKDRITNKKLTLLLILSQSLIINNSVKIHKCLLISIKAKNKIKARTYFRNLDNNKMIFLGKIFILERVVILALELD